MEKFSPRLDVLKPWMKLKHVQDLNEESVYTKIEGKQIF